jgi:ADP-L-glycero-D-manno-heptose 6-epimerase
MASVAYHLNRQMYESGRMQLFAGCDGYGAGEQRRDFVYVEDVVKVILWMWEHPAVSGIFNVGTGRSQTFNEVAAAVLDHWYHGEIEYIPFPENLKGKYQSFTEADISLLRSMGYESDFMTIEQAVPLYLEWLSAERC